MKNKSKLISFDEVKKNMWRKMSFLGKVQSVWWDVWFTIKDKWWLITGTCPHEATINQVNSKKGVCLLCKKIVKIKNEKRKF